jgi:hypothetical protein
MKFEVKLTLEGGESLKRFLDSKASFIAMIEDSLVKDEKVIEFEFKEIP